MKRDVLFLTWPGHDFARKSVKGLWQWHENLGDKCRFSHFKLKPHEWKDHYRQPDIVYIWNGQYREHRKAFEFVRSLGCVVKYVEIGWFPQSGYIYVDDRGTNGNCSLHGSKLDWIDTEDFDTLARIRQTHLSGVTWRGSGNYIAVPLQISSDTQIRNFSGWNNMMQFMDHCERVFPRDDIQFKKHPKDNSTLGPRVFTGGNLHEWLSGSKLVYGINSTVLLESALMGAPTVSTAPSFLDISQDSETALAALCAKQIPVGETDLDRWMRHPDLGMCFDG